MDILELRKQIREGADRALSTVYQQEKANQEAAPFVLEVANHLSRYLPVAVNCRSSGRVSIVLDGRPFLNHLDLGRDLERGVMGFLSGIFAGSDLGVRLVQMGLGARVIRILPIGSEEQEPYVDIEYSLDEKGLFHG